MAVALLFWSFLLSATLLVLWYGRASERAFVIFLIGCAILTLAAGLKLETSELRYALIAIDLAILAVVLAIMRKSDAYWPVWFAGFQTIIVSTGLAHLILPSQVPAHYINLAGFWALPEMLVLVLGTVADYKARAAAPMRATA